MHAKFVSGGRAVADKSLGKRAGSVVHERQYFLGCLQQQRGADRVEIAVAIDIDQLHSGKTRPFRADLRHAILARSNKSPALIEQYREATATQFVDNEIEVAITIHIARRHDARKAHAAEECPEPHPSSSLENKGAAVAEHIDRLTDVIADRHIEVTVLVIVAERDRLRIATNSRDYDISKNGRFLEQAGADAAACLLPRHISAPGRDNVIFAVGVEITKLKPVDEAGRGKQLQFSEVPVSQASSSHQPIFGITSGDQEIGEPIAIEIAHPEHRWAKRRG